METMTMEEYMRWQAFFEEREMYRKRAENRARGVVDFTDPQAAGQLVTLVANGGRPSR